MESKNRKLLIYKFPINKGQLAVVHEIKSKNSPTIIFLHDSLGCIKTWRDFPKLIAHKLECNYLMYDRLGYGESSDLHDTMKRKKGYLEKEADILNEIIEQRKILQPIIFGHSDGGSIALIAASKKENNIKGIIVEAAHIFVEEITLDGIRKVKENYLNGELRKKLIKFHGSRTDDVFYTWTNTWLDAGFREWNIESILSKIICPCLILQGERDEFGTMSQAETIEQRIQGEAQKVILKNMGHTPHKENKALILNICSEFINSIKTKWK